jgi:hypothetical protein
VIRNRSLHWILALLLVFTTLLPVGNAFAASGAGYFTNFSLTSDLSSPISTDPNNPTVVYQSSISISAIYNNVKPDTVSYQVTQVSSGNVIYSQNQKPLTDPLRPNVLTFNSVPLMAGINKIQFFGTDSVTGATATSSPVYVQYNNSPSIYNVSYVSSSSSSGPVALSESSPNIVQSASISVTFDAPNSTSATVNGVTAFASQTHYFAQNISLNPGDNTIKIVAKGANGTITKTYSVVYFNGTFGVYSTTFGPDPIAANNPSIVQAGTSNVSFPGSSSPLYLNGNVIVPHSSSPISMNIEVLDPSGNPVVLDTSTSATSVPLTLAGVSQDATLNQDVYSFQATVSGSGISTAGTYKIVFLNPASSAEYGRVPFHYQASNATYISGVAELQSQAGPVVATIDPNTPYPVHQLPIWLQVTVANDSNPGTGNVSVYYSDDPSKTNIAASVVQVSRQGTTTNYGVRLDSLRSGSPSLVISYQTLGGPVTQTIVLTNINSPSIQILNIADGQNFNTSTPGPIQFQTNNIPVGTPIQINVNGSNAMVTTVAGQNTYYYPAQNSTITLIPGQNRITLSAQVGNSFVTTSITVFYLSNQLPQLTINTPLAANLPGNPPLSQVSNAEYATTDTGVILSGTMKNIDTLVININGVYFTTISDTQINGWSPVTVNGINWYYDHNLVSSITYDSNKGVYTFTLQPKALQTTGSTIFDFEASNSEGNTQSIKIQVDKTVPAFNILYPNLTNNAGIINQNFLPVVIQAQGADSVQINKLDAVKLPNLTDTFAVELQNLKSGLNTISFTVNRGTTKTTGKFTVNYLNQNTTGAKYKAQLPTNGKYAAFNNAITLTFPKNTFLQPPNDRPGRQPSPSSSTLDNSRYILAGIADPYTGSIEDGTDEVSIADNLLLTNSHFTDASKTFWIDAGFPNQQSYNGFTPVGGIDPLQPRVGSSWNLWGSAPNYMPFYSRGYSNWMQPTNPGQITLQYDPSIRNAVQTQLTVFYLGYTDSNGNLGWTNLGGVVNTSNHTITVPFAGFGYYKVVLETSSYPDIETHPWGKIALNTMYAKGIMLPKDNSHFSTDENITRGEFAEVLVKALNIPLNYDPSNMTFDDLPTYSIPGALWDYRYIETAARKGIVKGEAPRYFGANDDLTREQAAVMIAQALNYKLSLDPSTAQSSLAKMFTDSGTIDYYAMPAVLAVAKAKVMNGKVVDPNAKKLSYYFDPKAPLSRAEAASIAMKLMQSIKLLPTTT